MDALTEERLRMLEFQPSPNERDRSFLLPPPEPTQQRMHQQLWEMTGHWLSRLKEECDQLERDGLLGHAIFRACTECADAVAHLASKLEQEDDRALPFDPRENSLYLQINDEMDFNDTNVGENDDWAAEAEDSLIKKQNADIAEERDTANGVPPAIALCRDIEVALRAVEKEEAMDLADAALALGHLVLASLQHLHAQWTPGDTAMEDTSAMNHGFLAERVDLWNDTGQRSTSTRDIPESPFIIEITEERDHESKTTIARPPDRYRYSPPRVRCLWPPLLPLAQNGLHWTQDMLQKQPWPVPIALAIACGPLLATGLVVGGSVVATDHWLLQPLYTHWQQQALGIASEVAAASLVQSTRLAVQTTRAVARPTLRVLQRQVQRHAPALRDGLVYRVQHPVATVCAVVQGLGWCGGHVLGLLGQQWQEWQQLQPHPAHDDASVAADSLPEPSSLALPDMTL